MNNMRIFLGILVCTAAAGQAATMTIYSQTQSGSVVFGDSTPQVLTFTGTPPAATDATLSLIATGGELNLGNKRLEQLLVDGTTFQTPSQPAGWILPVNQPDVTGGFPPPVTIPLANLTGFVADGEVEVSVVRPGFLAGGTFDMVLEYTTTIPEPASGLLLIIPIGWIAVRRRR